MDTIDTEPKETFIRNSEVVFFHTGFRADRKLSRNPHCRIKIIYALVLERLLVYSTM